MNHRRPIDPFRGDQLPVDEPQPFDLALLRRTAAPQCALRLFSVLPIGTRFIARGPGRLSFGRPYRKTGADQAVGIDDNHEAILVLGDPPCEVLRDVEQAQCAFCELCGDDPPESSLRLVSLRNRMRPRLCLQCIAEIRRQHP